ncbi:hypothetical protein D3C81_1336760 [compost metagenome]
MERRKHGSLGPHTLVNLELHNLLFRVLQVQRTWIEGVQLLIEGLFLYLNGNPLYPRRITKVACMHRAGMGGQHPISWSHPLELAFQDLLGYVFNQGVT